MTDIVVTPSPNHGRQHKTFSLVTYGSWVSGNAVVQYSHRLRYKRLVIAILGLYLDQ